MIEQLTITFSECVTVQMGSSTKQVHGSLLSQDAAKQHLKSQKKTKTFISRTFVPIVTFHNVFLPVMFCEHTGSVIGLALSRLSCHLWTGNKAG